MNNKKKKNGIAEDGFISASDENRNESSVDNVTIVPETSAETDTLIDTVIDELPDSVIPSESFEESLQNFTSADLETEFVPVKRKIDFIRIIALVLCIGVCAGSVIYLIDNIMQKQKSDSIYEEILNGVDFDVPGVSNISSGGFLELLDKDNPCAFTPTMDDIIKNGVTADVTPDSYNASLEKMLASLERLRKINEDIYGWIRIPGTNIDYPIAQSDDNSYYLDHAYNGENLVNGSIFADYRCNHDVRYNYNTVLYGHNIMSGSMFHDVSKFFDEKVFNNTEIYIYTFEGIFVFKPFSIHEADYDSGYVSTDFETSEAFIEFANNLQDKSDVESNVTFIPDSRMLTLSTCTNVVQSRRFALHAVLVKQILK